MVRLRLSIIVLIRRVPNVGKRGNLVWITEMLLFESSKRNQMTTEILDSTCTFAKIISECNATGLCRHSQKHHAGTF